MDYHNIVMQFDDFSDLNAVLMLSCQKNVVGTSLHVPTRSYPGSKIITLNIT